MRPSDIKVGDIVRLKDDPYNDDCISLGYPRGSIGKVTEITFPGLSVRVKFDCNRIPISLFIKRLQIKRGV